MSNTNDLWRTTPLVRSHHLSTRTGREIYLKLENLQPCHSFKQRGLSAFVAHAKEQHGARLHCVIASGGNAGLAAAWAARRLQVRCTVFIVEGVSASTIALLRQYGAEVNVGGAFYLETLGHAREAVARDPDAVMVPAYDDPVIWEGHASMIAEIRDQFAGTKPDAIVCSVGGGGLLGGVLVGCAAAGWDDVPVLAMETHGAACFYHSVAANRGRAVPADVRVEDDAAHSVKIAHIPAITSRAQSLGASSPAAGVLAHALRRPGSISCAAIPDEMAMAVAVALADEEKLNVELACSTALAPAYHPEFLAKLLPDAKTIVFIVCGGFKVSVQELAGYFSKVEDVTPWEVWCDGETWSVTPTQHGR